MKKQYILVRTIIFVTTAGIIALSSSNDKNVDSFTVKLVQANVKS